MKTYLDYGAPSCFEEATHCCLNCENCNDCEEQREYYHDKAEENDCQFWADAT